MQGTGLKMAMTSELMDGLMCGDSLCDCQKSKRGKGHVHCPAHDDAPDTNGPTSKTALRDLLDVVDLEDHSPIVQLFVGGLALALDSEERGSK